MRKSAFIFITVFLSAAFFIGCGSAYNDEYYEDTAVVFGDMTISVMLRGGSSTSAFNEMVSELKKLDKEISLTVSPDSPLLEYNNSALGEITEVGFNAYTLLNLSKEFYDKTDGTFNPAAADISALWRIDAANSKYFKNRVEPDFLLPDFDTEVAAALDRLAVMAATEYPFGVKAYEEDGKYYFEKTSAYSVIDFGAIAKGYAADICGGIADRYGLSSAVIDISGNIAVYGDYYYEGEKFDFPIPLTDPRSLGIRGFMIRENLLALNISGPYNSLVASGDYQRYYYYKLSDDYELPICHILDPNSALPIGVYYDETVKEYRYSDDAVISAAVLADNSAMCDAYATAVCVMGYEGGVEFLLKEGVKGIVIKEGEVTFVGISDSDLYRHDGITLQRYNAVYREFAAGT